MAGKREAKRKALREGLISAAQRRIIADGSSALRARDLAKDVGCAVGAIYNAFDDLDDLHFHVRALIFQNMVDTVSAQLDKAGLIDPKEHLHQMAILYWQYAKENTNTWSALFDSPIDMENVPDWYLGAMATLLEQVTGPIGKLKPDLPEEDVLFVSRMLFSAVHGIVVLHIQQRPAGMSSEDIPTAFKRLIAGQLAFLSS